MKRFLLLLLAVTASIIVVECTVSQLLKYPKYAPGSRTYNLNINIGDYSQIVWGAPYYCFWSVDGNNKVFTYNNIGLPSDDIDESSGKKYIAILGDSYIEGLQYPGNQSAVSIFNAYYVTTHQITGQ